jgi:MFS family permease
MSAERKEELGELTDDISSGPSLRLPDTGRLTRMARTRAKRVVMKQVPGGARYAFRVDLAAMSLAGIYLGAVFPFVNVIARKELHASATVLALMAAAPFFGNLMALFWARAMDGKKKTPFVKWSHVGARSSIMLAMFTWSAVPFAWVISAAQIIGTVATPAYAAIIKDVYPESQRGRILSITRAAIVVAQMASTLLVGWLLTFVSYRVIFPIAALFGITAALIFSRINPGEEAGGDEGESARVSPLDKIKDMAGFVWSTLGILKTDVSYRWFALSVFTYGFGNLLNMPIFPLIQVNELGINEWQISLLTVTTQLAMAFAFFYWGRFVDFRSPQLAVAINILINSLIPIIYIMAGTVLPANPWVLFPAFIVTGIVNAGIDLSYFSALLTFAGDKDISRYQALQSFLLGIRGSIAPFVGAGMVRALKGGGHDLRWAFAVSLVFILAGCWMQFVAMRKQAAGPRIAE